MASKKKLTPAREKALQEYNKERRRIQSTVRRAIKRGYIFDKGVVPPSVSELNSKNVPTVSIKALVRKFHEVKPIHLYKQSTAVSFETDKVISGVQRRREERHESAVIGSINRTEKLKELRSIQTIQKYWKQKEDEVRRELGEEPVPEEKPDFQREAESIPLDEILEEEVQSDLQRARNELTDEQKQQAIDEEEAQWQKQQAERDKLNKKRLSQDKSYAEQFEQGNIILQNIQQMIDSAMSDGTYKQAGMDLSIELSQQINEYGRDKVAMAMSQVPQEAIEDAQVALNYNPGDERHDKAIIALRELITGEIPSAEELKEMQDRMDADAYTNDIG